MRAVFGKKMDAARIRHGNNRSILDDHLNTVIELRRRGLSWEKVAEELRGAGVPATAQNLWKWFKRRQRRATKVARELRPFEQLKVAPESGVPAIGSIHNPATTKEEAQRAIKRLQGTAGDDEFKPQPVTRKRQESNSASSTEVPQSDERFEIGDDVLQ